MSRLNQAAATKRKEKKHRQRKASSQERFLIAVVFLLTIASIVSLFRLRHLLPAGQSTWDIATANFREDKTSERRIRAHGEQKKQQQPREQQEQQERQQQQEQPQPQLANSGEEKISERIRTHDEQKQQQEQQQPLPLPLPLPRARKFFRYDEAGPKPIKGTARSHALPIAVPDTNIIPREKAESKRYHISQRKNSSMPHSIVYPMPSKHNEEANYIKSTDPEKYNLLGRYNWNHTHHDDYRTLYLYNPSVLPLHNTVPRQPHHSDSYSNSYSNSNSYSDPESLSATELQELTGGDPRVRYVAVYRAYMGCNCFGKGDRILMQVGEQISYFAMVLLDESLDIIEGTDVLIDLNAHSGHGIYKYHRQGSEDCRIFLIKGGIYLICNELMRRIRIKRKKQVNEQTPQQQQQQKNQHQHQHPPNPPPGYGTKEKIKMPYTYPTIRGDGLEVTLLSQTQKINEGKNFNVFRAPAAANSTASISSNSSRNTAPRIQHDYYLQIFPAPHQYQKLSLADDGDDSDPAIDKDFSQQPVTPREKLPQPTFDTPDTAHNVSLCPDKPKQKMNDMNCSDPVDFPFFGVTDDHGTACCVKVVLPLPSSSKGNDNDNDNNNDKDNDNGNHNGNGNGGNKRKTGREVMVGIIHQKLSARDNYWLLDVHRRYEDFGKDRFVSRFVAYDVHPPFDIVALSGWFCLGFADEAESDGRFGSTLAGKNTQFRLDIFSDTYDCPIIHFASGFSEAVDNSSRAIIAYGINDCHPRMFFVEKDEIVRLLIQ